MKWPSWLYNPFIDNNAELRNLYKCELDGLLAKRRELLLKQFDKQTTEIEDMKLDILELQIANMYRNISTL